MIEAIILASSPIGSASFFLQQLVNSDKIRISSVVLSQGKTTYKAKHYKSKLNKLLRIGPFGAINGIRMRKWYSTDISNHLTMQSLEALCKLHNIPLYLTPTINCPETVRYFNKSNADIGLSLGNSYIGSKVFNMPKWGMINIHHELLPDFQNAASIIWQIYNNSRETGYTIHKITKNIDAGEILIQERIPIELKRSLRNTVSYNYAELWKHSAKGLIKVLENFEEYFNNSKPQGLGKSYTTPTLIQYLKIVRNFTKMKKMQPPIIQK